MTDSSIEHTGVKGMHWGVRKDGTTTSTETKTGRLARSSTDIKVKQKAGNFVQTTGGKRHTATDDAVRVAAARQLAKKSTTDSLSTKQLQEAVNRMNLEQQYSNLVKKSDRRKRGQRFIQALMKSPEAKQAVKSAGNNFPNRAVKITSLLA